MVKSAARVLRLLDRIAQFREGVAHTELARELAIPKSSLTGLLQELTTANYIAFDEDTGRYRIGPKVLDLSRAYLNSLNIVAVAQPVITKVFHSLHEFTALSVLKDREFLIICAENLPLPMSHSLQIGERVPLHGTAVGKIFLAYYSPERRNSLLESSPFVSYTPHTIRSRKRLLDELKEVQKRGIAYSREEYLAGFNAIAAPVFDAQSAIVGALFVAIPAGRFTRKHEQTTVAALRDGAETISKALGCRG